jgi:hypothetical protein
MIAQKNKFMSEENKKPQIIVIGHIPHEDIEARLALYNHNIEDCEMIMVENEQELYEKHGIIAPQTPNENIIRPTPVFELTNPYKDLPMDTLYIDDLMNSKPYPTNNKGGKKNRSRNKWGKQ